MKGAENLSIIIFRGPQPYLLDAQSWRGLKTVELADEIVSKALELNYTKCGIIKISQMKDYSKELDKRVKLYPEVEPIYKRFY